MEKPPAGNSSHLGPSTMPRFRWTGASFTTLRRSWTSGAALGVAIKRRQGVVLQPSGSLRAKEKDVCNMEASGKRRKLCSFQVGRSIESANASGRSWGSAFGADLGSAGEMMSSFLGECHQVWVHVTPATRALWASVPAHGEVWVSGAALTAVRLGRLVPRRAERVSWAAAPLLLIAWTAPRSHVLGFPPHQ